MKVAVASHLRQDKTKHSIIAYILELLKLVLQSINSTLNYDNYLQIDCTALGTELALNYAKLFMDRFETQAIKLG